MPLPVLYFRTVERTPSQAPKLPEGKKETPPIDTAKRLETLNQIKFKERVEKVQELQEKLDKLRGTRNPTQKIEYDSIHEQMAGLAKQFNQELGLNIDFTKLPFVTMYVGKSGKGLGITALSYDIESEIDPSTPTTELFIGLRPDGTYESRIINPGNKNIYFDSRTGQKAEYNLDLPEDEIRFEKERAGHVFPSTE